MAGNPDTMPTSAPATRFSIAAVSTGILLVAIFAALVTFGHVTGYRAILHPHAVRFPQHLFEVILN